MTEINIPELGDGIAGGTVVSISFQVGDAISIDDTLLEIETDKAVLPVPSPNAGTIQELFIKEGEEVVVGQKICSVSASEDGNSDDKTSNKTDTKKEKAKKQYEQQKESDNEEIEKNNLGTKKIEANLSSATPQAFNENIIAGPAVRKLARELGIDLQVVHGSGKGGRIFIEDVKEYVKQNINASTSENFSSNSLGSSTIKPLPDFSIFGETKTEPISKLRKTIAAQMDYCWQTIPHVHQFHDIDVTEIVELQKKYGQQFKEKGSAVSVTLFIIKAMAQCLKEFPLFNSSYDALKSEIVYKQYYNVGVAVDTPSGLIVPVLKDIDKKSIFEIGKELKEIAKKTRDRTILPKDLQGASMTLSNLGGIGGTHFTPIINSPEVAIIGVGRNRIQGIYREDKFVPRSILPLCLAYDHRVIDGAEGARFIVRLSQLLQESQTMLMGYTQ